MKANKHRSGRGKVCFIKKKKKRKIVKIDSTNHMMLSRNSTQWMLPTSRLRETSRCPQKMTSERARLAHGSIFENPLSQRVMGNKLYQNNHKQNKHVQNSFLMCPLNQEE